MDVKTPPPAYYPSYKDSAPYQYLRTLVKPFWAALKHRRDIRKFAHHSYSKSFDWNWGSANYNRIAVVNLLLAKRSEPAYLEIGCASNALFDSVPVRNKVGVDPAAGGTVREPSDKFFEKNKSRFDVIFIDGLHTYDQVRRDVVNSLKCLNEGGWIALHDMLPRTWIEHHVPIVTMPSDPWTGDVWKVAFELIQTPGLEFKLLKIDRGVGVIKVLKQDITVPDLSTELHDKEFAYFYENIGKLPVVEWDDAYPWLRS